MSSDQLLRHFHPEAHFGGFSEADAMVEFYSRIAALLRPTDHVLDYGAGRGAQIEEDNVPYRRSLKTLKGRCAHLEGCDVDAKVLENPYLDSARLFDPEKPLPYEDGSFDLIYANWVFEHVEDPAFTSSELLRILKPGGYICAVTPNRKGYIALASRLAGNASHVPFLKKIQPDRKEMDVFPTRYRLNTSGAIYRYFGKHAEVVSYAISSEPAYTFNNTLVYRAFQILHSVTPKPLQPILLIFIRKH